MAAEVDVRAVSIFSSIPESDIANLLDNPTTELVKSLLQSITSKAKEYDQFKSQKIRLEVELEQSVRTRESKIKVFKNSVEKSLAEASKLRVELQKSENARSKLESEVEQIRSASTQDASEAETLRSRISSLEASHRDTVAVLDSKTAAYEKISQDLSTQHQKAVELRRQIGILEQTIQSINSAASSAKFREQSLIQELDQAKKANEWFENELKTKQADHTKFRKEKNARISELTQSNEQYISEAEALRRSEAALRNRLDEQAQRFEESLQELQQLREEKISDTESFRIELESAARLAELQKAAADTAKQRAQELSQALEEAKEDAAEEVGKIRAENETEHKDKEEAERRVAELESVVEQLETELDRARVQPSTPQRGVNGTGTSTPIRPGTPSGIFSPASASRLRGNLSMTTLYSEYQKMELELANEKRRSEQLQNSLDTMVQDLEANQPEIEELRSEHARLQSEVVEMSTLVDSANRDREAAIKEARTYQGQAQSRTREAALLTQQVRDATAQIKVLIMEAHLRENGQELNAEEMADLQRAAAGQDVADLSPTGRLVSENLTTFRTISELQEQNTKMLRMIRELGAQMESNDAKDKEHAQLKEHEELEAARARITLYEDELQALLAQSRSFMKERDMFRTILTRKGHFPAQIDPTDFSRSLPVPAGGSPARGLAESIQGSIAGGESDYAKLLKDLQLHFDSYRQEAATDHSSLKNQVNDLSKKNSQLQTDVTRTLSQLSSANQRYEMLQSNFNMIKAENAELQKRSYAAMEIANKQELKTQQAAEEIVETRGLIDSMRRETANLKAEKDLWKNVERRLIEDSESLRNERGRLDQLNSSLQNILNEREQSDSETRRRLQAYTESLESELQTTKRKLNDESEESKKISQRREYEHEQNQKRIDDLVASLGSTREELVAAKTARDHLQSRVDEMAVELRSAEERLNVLTQPTSEPTNGTNGVDEGTLSHEQELAVEVSELKRDLELKTTELSRANEQIEVYKSISQSSEERLQELTETNDSYREDTEATLTEKDKKVKDLEQRIEDITSELSTTNNELSKLRDEQSESSRRLDEQKTSFEAEISRLKEQEERSAEQAQFNLEASKAQAQIATDAQQNYENELVKHAEAAKSLHSVRSEANQLRLEMVDLKTQVETAQTTLRQREESWAELKDRYERELTDVKMRREEVMQQNTILHGQLESVTKQITALQRDRAANAEGEVNDATNPDREELQELIRFLRREKDIVEVQYNLLTQDAKRLRQQLDHTRSQLDETRLKLDQQRRAEGESERNALSHNKLMETLNELNLYRESSVTLRAEAKQASQALVEKTQQVEDLRSQIEPLQAHIAELENLSELREGEMKLLQDDRDHWQQRTQNILSKYDRVDPAELESLKDKVSALETERDEAIAAQAALQTQVDAFPEQLQSTREELRTRLAEQFKARSKDLSGKIRDKQTEVDTAVAEKADLQVELDSLKDQLDLARSQATTVNPTVNGVQETNDEPKTVTADRGSDQSGRIAELEGQVAALESSLTQKEKEIATLKAEEETKYKARDAQLKEMLNKRLGEVKQAAQAAKVDALKELEAKLQAEHQQELEAMRAQSVPIAAGLQNSNEIPTLQTPVEEAPTQPQTEGLPTLTDEQIRLLVKENEVIRKIMSVNIRKRVEDRENELRKEFAANQVTSTQTASAEGVAELENKFITEKEALIKEKEDQFVLERQTLIKGYEDKLASEKQSLIIDNQEKLASERLSFSKDAEKKIADQVALAEKRTSVKLNMAENRARQAGAKLEIVKHAAEETPQKPVIEVWEIAKNTKAPPANAIQQPKSVIVTAPPAEAPSTSQGPAGARPSEAVPDTHTQPPQQSGEEQSQPAVPNGPLKPTQNNVGTGPAVLRSLQSGLPRGASSVRGGRGGAALPNQVPQGSNAVSNQQQSAPNRGTGIPRAGGQFRGNRGGGRAGAQNVQTSLPQAPGRPAAGTGSPRGNLNPAAVQFTPQNNKRAREDGEGVDSGNIGKRIRGASGSVS